MTDPEYRVTWNYSIIRRCKDQASLWTVKINIQSSEIPKAYQRSPPHWTGGEEHNRRSRRCSPGIPFNQAKYRWFANRLLKNRIITAVERIETADPNEKPDPLTVASKFTRSLDLNRFEELMRQCWDDETKYAATLSAAHNQASTQLIAVKGKLVPCETLKRNSNIAGAAEIKG